MIAHPEKLGFLTDHLMKLEVLDELLSCVRGEYSH